MHQPIASLNKILTAHLHPNIAGGECQHHRTANINHLKKYQAITYGQCEECGCPAFAGEGTYCTRIKCGHHWKSHKAV